MIDESEVIIFLLGVGTLIFISIYYTHLKKLPNSTIFIIAFVSLLLGWLLTILEGFYWEEILNLLQHACYAISSILITIWCYLVFIRRRNSSESRIDY